MSERKNIANIIIPGQSNDFVADKERVKRMASRNDEPFIELNKEPASWISCQVCGSFETEEFNFGNRRMCSYHVIDLCKNCQQKMIDYLQKNLAKDTLKEEMTCFESFYKRLEHYTAAEIIRAAKFYTVSANGNKVVDDNHLEIFLKSINTTIEDYGVGYCLLSCQNKWYEVPYEETDSGTMILTFECATIYDVTDSYETE